MPTKTSVVGSYLIGTDVLVNCADVVGHRGARAGAGWQRTGGGWIGPGGQPVFISPGEIEPVLDLSDDDLVGELESLIESDWGTPGTPIMTDDEAALGKPLVLVGGPRGGGGPRGPRGGHPRGGWGRGWGRGPGWSGYPWGPPLDYGYTVVQENDPIADLAIAEAIQKNTELQQKLHEKEIEDKARKADKAETKSVVGKGGGHGGGHGGGGRAQGFYRGGWFGGNYPEPFAYYGPYESVDTALNDSSAGDALAELLQQNATLEQQLSNVIGREDFDERTLRHTGLIRGGR